MSDDVSKIDNGELVNRFATSVRDHEWDYAAENELLRRLNRPDRLVTVPTRSMLKAKRWKDPIIAELIKDGFACEDVSSRPTPPP